MGRPKLDRSKVCPRCGKEFRPKDWRNTFCGYECSALAREEERRGGPMPTKTCAHCGTEFAKSNEYSYANWARIRFCSNRCKGAGRRRTVKLCVGCGNTFAPADRRRSLAAKYCSQGCYWLTLRTEHYPVRDRRRGQEFSFRTRRYLIERAEGRCESCGATEHLEFDHIVPCHAGGTNDESNGQVLCRDCHGQKTAREIAELFAQ